MTTPVKATRYMPNYVVESTTVTAGEVEPGDLLVEVLPHHGIRAARIEAVVIGVTDGPSHHGQDWDSPSLGRVRIATHGSSPLLPVGHPVVVRRHIAA